MNFHSADEARLFYISSQETQDIEHNIWFHKAFYRMKIHFRSYILYSVTCLNRIPMGPNILSGLDRIRITQTCLFLKNFCIVVALIIKCAYYWMD